MGDPERHSTARHGRWRGGFLVAAIVAFAGISAHAQEMDDSATATISPIAEIASPSTPDAIHASCMNDAVCGYSPDDLPISLSASDDTKPDVAAFEPVSTPVVEHDHPANIIADAHEPADSKTETASTAVTVIDAPVVSDDVATPIVGPVRVAARTDAVDTREATVSPPLQEAMYLPHFRQLDDSTPAPRLRSLGRKFPPGSILVRNGERKLYYFVDAYFALEFPIGVGRRALQKVGVTRITDKRRHPTWVPTPNQHRVYRNLPGAMPPGPKNPLGTRALNLTIPNYRIHGTHDASYINNAKSDGCYHLYNHDIEYLFDLVKIGTVVVLER